MGRKKGVKNKLIELPDEYKNMKYVVMDDIDPDYILFEDGRIYSKKIGDFKIPTISRGYEMYSMNGTSFDVDYLIRRYFKQIDDLKKGDFVPIKDFDEYLINKKGQIYSLKYFSFISSKSRTVTGWPIVCLMKDGKRHTAYIAKLVYNTFVGDIPEGHKLDFLNGRKSDCRLENLVLKRIVSYFKKQEQK